MINQDEIWMREALLLAEQAAQENEVPVGALIVKNNQVIASGYNQREQKNNPLFHGEIMAINEAAENLKSWRLEGCTLYVTLEPCVMCAGAIVQSRIEKVVYGAKDPKGGGVESLYSILADARLNHRPQVVGGVLEQECSEILKVFFAKLRLQK